MASIPEFQDLVRAASSLSNGSEEGGETSILHHETGKDDDDEESQYSHTSASLADPAQHPQPDEHENGMITPRARTPQQSKRLNESQIEDSQMSLPQFDSILDEDDFGLGLRSYMSPSPKLTQQSFAAGEAPRMSSVRDYLQQDVNNSAEIESPPESAVESEHSNESGTPEPVARQEADSVSPPQHSPGIPEPVATIKAPGGRLKTRPSVTPADISAMAAARRKVSNEEKASFAVPPIPERHRDRPSLNTSDGDLMPPPSELTSRQIEINRRKSLVKLEMPVPGSDEDLSFGIDKAFDRIKEAQKVY